MSNSEKYSKIFEKIFSINKSKLKKLKYQSIPQWDSVGHMSMISNLEKTFKITVISFCFTIVTTLFEN